MRYFRSPRQIYGVGERNWFRRAFDDGFPDIETRMHLWNRLYTASQVVGPYVPSIIAGAGAGIVGGTSFVSELL